MKEPRSDPRRRRARRSLFSHLSLLVFSFIFSLTAGEVLCAIFAPSTFVTTDIFGRKIRNRPTAHYQVAHHGADTYWDLVPSQSGREKLLNDYDYYWSINSLGLRGPELEEKEAGGARVVVLGDSLTFGVGVEQDRTFPAQLESMLADGGGPRVQVLNAGVSGYGTFEALWKWERIARVVKPDLVIVVCFVDNALVPDEGNDLWSNHVRITGGGAAFGGFRASLGADTSADIRLVAEHSHLYGLLSRAKRALLEESFQSLIARYRREYADSPELRRVWEQTRSLILQIDRQGREVAGARTMVLHLPGIASLELGDRSAIEELEKTGLPVASAHETLLEGASGDLLSLAFRHDRHYNGAANALIAKQLTNFVREKDLLASPPDGSGSSTEPGGRPKDPAHQSRQVNSIQD